ncbi:MAG TPA: acyl-CoA thioesterase [Gammaproteobacteria bacterium]|nr:acyl-CoA thioesterase [Gammaproteobacteria bacterium]
MTIEYVKTIKPRITDINYGGHLGHIELIGLLHEVRVQFLNNHNCNEFEIDGCALFMKTLQLDYINQAFWNEQLKIQMSLVSEGARIIFKYIVNNLVRNNTTAKAEAIMVLVSKKNQKPLKPDLFFETLNNDKNPG